MVVLTKGGLKSQAPLAGTKVGRAIQKGRGTISGGGSSNARNDELARRAAEKKARAEAAAAEKAIKEKAAKEKAKVEARARQERQGLKNKLMAKLIADNKRIGLLTNRASANRIIESRMRARDKDKYYTIGEVQPVVIKSGTKGNFQALQNKQKIRATTSIRNKQSNIRNEAALLGITIGVSIIRGASATVNLPSALVNVAKNPSQLLRIPSAIARGGKVLDN